MQSQSQKPEVAGNTSGHRVWSLTFYENEFSLVEKLKIDKPKRKWVVFQHEICPETGREHIQAGISYISNRKFDVMKKEFPGVHLEPGRNSSQLWHYCQKEESRKPDSEIYIWGEEPIQGKRTDLEFVAQQVIEKKTLKEIALESPETFIKFHRGITNLKSTLSTKRDGSHKVFWVWGLSGVGKTRLAYENANNPYIKDGTQWWDGYDQTENDRIIIDDFDGKWPYRDLLRLLDRYPYQGQIKGGYVQINSDIWITCEHPPEEFWKDNELTQVKRRITEIIHLT